MVIFGGFFEITKELNDLILFDLRAHCWIKVFEDCYSPHLRKSGVIKNLNSGSAYMQKESGEDFTPSGKKK